MLMGRMVLDSGKYFLGACRLSGVIGSCRAGARFGSGHVVSILLIAQNEHHISGEPVKIRHLLGLLAAVMVGY